MPPIFFYDLLLTSFFRQLFFTCSIPPYVCSPPLFFVFSHQTPSCAAVSCIFSSRLHYSMFLQLHHVCLYICMQHGTYQRTCSFLFTLPSSPLILNFLRERPVPFYSPFLRISKALEPKWKEGLCS